MEELGAEEQPALPGPSLRAGGTTDKRGGKAAAQILEVSRQPIQKGERSRERGRRNEKTATDRASQGQPLPQQGRSLREPPGTGPPTGRSGANRSRTRQGPASPLIRFPGSLSAAPCPRTFPCPAGGQAVRGVRGSCRWKGGCVGGCVGGWMEG